ncbi:MAG: hypothetical protein KF684_11650 [Phycisphaeraceae bacterium]|nr:hypothetical protein [Phycisphaeraceae bacterium]
MKITMMLAAAGVALSMHATAFAAPSPNAYIDAQGDELRPYDGKGFAHDLAYINAFFDLSRERFIIEAGFHNPIKPSWGAPESVSDDAALVGFIGFDLDNDPTTGSRPIQNDFGDMFPRLGLGLDLELALTRYNPQGYLRGVLFEEEIEARTKFYADRFVASIDLALFRDRDIPFGEYGFAAIFGTEFQPTDATDSIGTTYVVPTPATGALAALGGVAAMIRRRR